MYFEYFRKRYSDLSILYKSYFKICACILNALFNSDFLYFRYIYIKIFSSCVYFQQLHFCIWHLLQFMWWNTMIKVEEYAAERVVLPLKFNVYFLKFMITVFGLLNSHNVKTHLIFIVGCYNIEVYIFNFFGNKLKYFLNF